MVARKAAAAAKNTRPAALSGDDLTVGEVQDAPAAFARGGLSEDHGLAVAFRASVEQGVAKRLSVSDPALAEKLIRKYASTLGLGVRVLTDASTITIKGGAKKQFPGRNKGSEVGSLAGDHGGDEDNSPVVVPSTAVPPSAEDFLGGDGEEEER
jgi:hypothetical protein